MITRSQYDVLCGMSDRFPLVVQVKYGRYSWQSVSEAAVMALVQMGAITSQITGELGDHQLTFRPTVKAHALKEEYEANNKAERRGRRR